MSEELEGARQADYNSAQYAIDRVNVIKNDLHLAKITKNFSVWIDLLFNYLSEVSPQMSPEQERDYKAKLRSARTSIKRPAGLKDFYREQIYDDLFDVELDLERFYDSRGNKFRYTEERREVSFDADELSELRKFGGGGDWANLNKN